MVLAQGPSYPLGADVAPLPEVERWRPLANWALVIPHQVWLWLLSLGALVVTVPTWFAVVFTGRAPSSWSDYTIGVLRYQWRVTCYLYAWTDRYPSFTPVAGAIDPGEHPAILYCAKPPERNRMTVLFRAILAIPHLLALYVVGVVATAALIAAWFTVLFTGRWPGALRNFVVGFVRWQMRLSAYVLLVCDEYPPFSVEP